MAVVNDVQSPYFEEEKTGYSLHIRQRKFLHHVKEKNRPIKKKILKDCHNCSHYLSKYYYWKKSQCEDCIRSPAFYYRLSKNGLSDNWESITQQGKPKKCTNSLILFQRNNMLN